MLGLCAALEPKEQEKMDIGEADFPDFFFISW